MKVVAISKKYLLVLCCMASLQLTAQKTYFDVLINLVPGNFHYGEANDDLKDFKKNLNGLQAGVSLRAGVTPNFSLVSEFYFLIKGGRLTEGNPLTDLPTKTRLYTLELPALARVHLGKFYFNAGPSVAYNLAGKQIFEETESTPKESYKLLFDGSEGSYNRWDAGVQIGVGYEFKLKKTHLALDLRYSHGLVNVANDMEKRNRYLNFNVLISKPWKTNPLAKK